MSASQSTATEASTATAVTEEDTLRAYARTWRDTAVGRANHTATCPNTSHRTCGGTA